MNRTGGSSRLNGRPRASARSAGLSRRASLAPGPQDRPLALFGKVRALFLDVDGVLTDGSQYWGRWGESLKRFNILDGKGIEHLRKAGIKVFLISGERSRITRRYARSVEVDGFATGVEDKRDVLRRFVKEHRLALGAVAYMGDDDVDLPCMNVVGLPVAVPNGVPEVRAAARYVTGARGGKGAVREVADLILLASARTLRTSARARPMKR